MIDQTWRISTDAPRGPFQMMDVIGLRTMYNIAAASGEEHIQVQARYLKERYIDQGRLGRETGEGSTRIPLRAEDQAGASRPSWRARATAWVRLWASSLA